MSNTKIFAGAIVTFFETDFKCPKCDCPHSENDWLPRYENSKKGLIYRSCKGCKTKLGITTDIKGDVRVWLKEDETKTWELRR